MRYPLMTSEELANSNQAPMTDEQKIAYAINLIEVYGPEFMHGEPKKIHLKRLRKPTNGT